MLARNPHRGTAPAPCRRGLPLALLAFLLVSACGGPAKGPESVSPPGEWRSFEGTGSATGHRQTLRMGPDRKVSIVNLSGSLLLIGERRLGEGFRIDVIGSTDSLKGGDGLVRLDRHARRPGLQRASRGPHRHRSPLYGDPAGRDRAIRGRDRGVRVRVAVRHRIRRWKPPGADHGAPGPIPQDVPPASPERNGSRGKDGSVHEPAWPAPPASSSSGGSPWPSRSGSGSPPSRKD